MLPGHHNGYVINIHVCDLVTIFIGRDYLNDNFHFASKKTHTVCSNFWRKIFLHYLFLYPRPPGWAKGTFLYFDTGTKIKSINILMVVFFPDTIFRIIFWHPTPPSGVNRTFFNFDPRTSILICFLKHWCAGGHFSILRR